MSHPSQTRREMHQVLNGGGERPAPSLGITRLPRVWETFNDRLGSASREPQRSIPSQG